MNRPIPFDYQQSVIDRVYAEWRTTRNVVAVVPTGGGKSVIVGTITHNDSQSPGHNVIGAHRNELVGQLSEHVADQGIKHRILAPRDVVSEITAAHREKYGRSFVDPDATTHVGGVDTILSRQSELADWGRTHVRRWTVDEAHHVLRDNKWGRFVKLFPNAYGLGVTASPGRPDGNGIGDELNGGHGVFGAMVLGPTTRELINMGRLCEYEIAPPVHDIDEIKLKIGESGEYTQKSVREATGGRLVGSVVDAYVKFANGKQGITFAADVKDATAIAAEFNSRGIPAAVIIGDMDGGLRRDYIKRFKRKELRQLVNVDVLGEGFDVPGIEVVSMARPTASLIVYLQQFGRVLRVMAGKRFGLVIDHVGNVKRHGLPDKVHHWTLASRDRKRRVKEFDPDDIPVVECGNVPECGIPYEAVLPCCPKCGWRKVPKEGGRSIEQVDGDLTLLTAEALAEMRRIASLDDPAEVWARVAQTTGSDGIGRHKAEQHAARIASRDALASTIALWAGHGRALGRSDSEMYRRFYFGAGVDVTTALGLEKAKMDQLNEQIKTWLSR